MKVNVLTIFPEMFSSLKGGLIGKALKKDLWKLNLINLIHYSEKGKLDDSPLGGGEGMVIMPTVLQKAIEQNNLEKTKIFFMSPRGKVFNQNKAEEMKTLQEFTIICGRYEGIDQRIIDFYNIEELSVGDFILCGGEIAACTVIEATIRLLPETLHNAQSVQNESFNNILLEHNHYTHPRTWNNIEAPEYLKTGHGLNIWKKRLKESAEITKKNREDLFFLYVFLVWFKFLFISILKDFVSIS